MPELTKNRTLGLLSPQGRAELYPYIRQTQIAPLSFRDYIPQAWPIIEPKREFLANWHIDAIAEHLEAVTHGHIKRLIINIPPRMAKSILCCVMWPTWEWTVKPETRWLFASYSYGFSKRDAVRSRRLINSTWYQSSWGHVFSLTSDQNEKMRYENDKTGFRLSTSVDGTATGDGGDRRVIDDPIKPSDAHSDTKRKSVNDWWAETWSTRTNDPKLDADVIVMQRLHERDLSGHILEEISGYEHLCLPMRFDETRRSVTALGWQDPRQVERELLHPERFDETAVRELEKKLGSAAAGQLQQAPAPATGNIFKTHWWKFWQYAGQNLPPVMAKRESEDGNVMAVECEVVTLPDDFDEQLQSWDLAFKDKKSSDFVCGQVWNRKGSDKYLIDQVLGKMDFVKSIAAIRALSAKYPRAAAKLIEDKANGPAVISSLRGQIAGLIPVNPEGSKEARAYSVTPTIEAGDVYLPHPSLYPWVQPLLDELSKFPNAANDDQVDALTQALKRWVNSMFSWGR